MTMIRLDNPDRIAPFLRKNVFLHIYALGDLDAVYWPFTNWFGLERGGELQAVLLLYSGFDPPTLLALGEPPYDPLHELLRLARPHLPGRVYAHLSPGCRDALGPGVISDSRGPHLKMALVRPRLDPPGVDRVERLSAADVPDLRDLYAAGYPGNWFDPRQMESGHYYGLRTNGQLVSAGGPHVYSPTQRVAALGNIVTHPEHRGRGYAAAVTARLCAELKSTVDHIGLNVRNDNRAARGCYERIGFEVIAEYEESALTLSPP